jgi:hypothetical protein
LLAGHPLFTNVGSEYAFNIVRQLMLLSRFFELGPNYHFFSGSILDFRAGRCAFLAGAPGLAKYVTLTGGVRREDENGTVIWQPSSNPTRLPMVRAPRSAIHMPSCIVSAENFCVCASQVGPTLVLDQASGTLVNCTPTVCPYATGQPLVNNPPFFGSGGFATAIDAHAPVQLKQMLLDFIAYLNAPEQSVPDTASMGFMDPYRESHLADSAIATYQSKVWPDSEREDLFALERQLLLGQKDNAAMDLRVPYRNEFIFEPSLPSIRTKNYDSPRGWEYLVYQRKTSSLQRAQTLSRH